MARLASIKIVCAVGIALAFNQQLRAQGVEIDTGPLLETSPENGSAIAGSLGSSLIPTEIPGEFKRPLLTIAVVGGYDDNVNTSTTGGSSSSGGSGSLYTNENAELSYTFGTPRTLVKLDTGGGVTYYFDQATDRINAHLGLYLTHKQTARLTLSLVALVSYQSQPDFSTNLGGSHQMGSFLQSMDKASLTYSWMPRFSTVTTYTLGVLNYGSSSGTPLNRMEHTFGQEFRYLVWPTTTGVAEYRYMIIDYDTAPLNSQTHFLIAGLDHTFTPLVNATVRGGVQLRSSESNGSQTSPYFESTFNYTLGHTASLRWTTRYSIEEADVSGASSSPAFRTGLDFRYQFTGRISGSLLLNYIHRTGGSGGNSSSSTNELDIAPSLRYAVTHHLAVNAGYHYIQNELGSTSGSYSRNIYFAGLNYRF
jgi:Putative beta-barrel porin 2